MVVGTLGTVMSKKQRFIAWGIYTVVAFLILFVGFDWKVSVSVSIIVGFTCGMINEVIHLLNGIRDNTGWKD